MTSTYGSRTFDEKLAVCRENVKNSIMFKELSEKLQTYLKDVEKIRCLAIGSFNGDHQARYQLALLLEIIDLVSCDKSAVSIYDPVFNDEDIKFIQDEGWSLEENVSVAKDYCQDTLFFLPHAPLDLTEKILADEKPKFWLANHIVIHTDRYTKVQLHDAYPMISKLVHVCEQNQTTQSTASDEQEFTTFVPKRKRRYNNKYKYKEPEIEYSSIKTYFKECIVVTDFNKGALLRKQPWVNSFSDLAFQLIL